MNTVVITSFVNRRESLFPLLTIFSSTCFASLATILPADERVGFPAVGTILPIHAETVPICRPNFVNRRDRCLLIEDCPLLTTFSSICSVSLVTILPSSDGPVQHEPGNGVAQQIPQLSKAKIEELYKKYELKLEEFSGALLNSSLLHVRHQLQSLKCHAVAFCRIVSAAHPRKLVLVASG
ncbi:hypothetical protein niasHT_018070 [Heterodera trifolii]|uniref:Uncharacterized protein n=1 Tax=Heterodera trifolii TaxID=157864 RepID=A0ABD2LKH3_9BILA